MRVVIVTNSAADAEAVRRGLGAVANLKVIGYVDGRNPCGDAISAALPDLVIVDEMHAPRRALERVAEVKSAAPRAKIVLITNNMSAEWLGEACEAGIHAAVAGSVGAAAVGTLVRQIATGTVFHAFQPAPAAMRSSGVSQLTARELQILRLVALGASNSRIASELWVTEQTVKFHLSNTYRKLGVANRTQASHYAHLHGLLGPVPAATTDETPSPRLAAA